MKKHIFLIIILCAQMSFAQQGFEPCFRFVAKDSVRIHLDKEEKPVTQDCAYFYRLAKVNPENLNIESYFEDYYIHNDTLAVKASVKEGKLEGNSIVYYDNGNKMMEGAYKNGKKTGEWKHWYENGKPYITYLYKDGQVRILEYFSRKGKVKVKDGNGTFKNSRGKRHATIEGKVKNGLPDGVWTLTHKSNDRRIYTETYELGKFIKGEGYLFGSYTKTTYTAAPFIAIDGDLEAAESLNLNDCNSCEKHMVGYKNIDYQSALGTDNFYSYLAKIYTTNNKKGYALCSFIVSETGLLKDISINNSSAVVNDDTAELKSLILNSGTWTPRILDAIMTKRKIPGISRRMVKKPIPTVINFVIHYTDKGYLLYPEAFTGAAISAKK
ncbi:toxin-antitoxin system YwqK family antitoxin [Aquimarina sp. SS2-1]|uniref:toxin-antitoxin system YwqK family antitoxin n=1 Tax=Aquimarina besae TaxID=3342247 RepID=UPI00366D1C7F